MRLSWKIGRLAGINIYVHATFLIVFFLMGDFGHGLARAVDSVVLVSSVFGCVILHELGHALMARRFGIDTADITLYPIGGVARLRRLPRAPGAELLIALAGPAVNFAIAAALVALALLNVIDLDFRTGAAPFLTQLLAINLILGLFNLIPAFPMDGGRVLRALLSIWIGRANATRIAATVGQVLAVAFGLFAAFYTQNPFHIFLALFIYVVARAEAAQVLYEEQAREFRADGRYSGEAPPGYEWIDLGNGLWQLAPRGARLRDPAHSGSPWF
jgi:Zn-dependent protease